MDASSGRTKMNVIDFIRINVEKELTAKGLPTEAVEYAVNHYRTVPSTNYKECLAQAVKMAKIIKGKK